MLRRGPASLVERQTRHERVTDMANTKPAARAINVEPWEPPPGTVKKRCTRCPLLLRRPDHRRRGNLTLSGLCQPGYQTDHGRYDAGVTDCRRSSTSANDPASVSDDGSFRLAKRWLRQQPRLMEALHELHGCDLVYAPHRAGRRTINAELYPAR